jgi:hypothetical protein
MVKFLSGLDMDEDSENASMGTRDCEIVHVVIFFVFSRRL